LRFGLPLEIDAYQIVFSDFKLALDRIDKEGHLAAALRILLRSALQLPKRQLHAHLGQKLPCLLQPDVVRLFDRNFPSSAALRYGPVLYKVLSS
jgi:hypothetical protein